MSNDAELDFIQTELRNIREALDAFEVKVQTGFAQIKARIDAIDARLDGLDKRVAALEPARWVLTPEQERELKERSR